MEATLAAIVAAAAPLVFASVGETLTERAGVVNLSLDGSILLADLTGFAAASTSGSVLVGFAAAAAVGDLEHAFGVKLGTMAVAEQDIVSREFPDGRKPQRIL